MLGNDLRVNNSPLVEGLDYPCENILAKLFGRLAVLTGCCVVATEAVLEINPCKVVTAVYGAEFAIKCVDSAADTCCPPIQQAPAYRPVEMDLLEDGNDRKLRKY